nr:endonuclease domain-containing protein [uncultured Devosia sp.]
MSAIKTQFAATAAKTLRANMTDAERKLWAALRNRKLLGFKFVRQVPVGRYIADFACREADLIIELDGGQHADSAHDKLRTTALTEHGYAVMRFWNNDVLSNLDGVVHIIAEHLNKAPSPGLRYAKPDLSPKGRGEVVPTETPGNSP